MENKSHPSSADNHLVSDLAKDLFERGYLSPQDSYELATLLVTPANQKDHADKEKMLHLGLINKGRLTPAECAEVTPYLLDIMYNSADPNIPEHITELLAKNDPEENNFSAPEKFNSIISRIKFWALSQIK